MILPLKDRDILEWIDILGGLVLTVFTFFLGFLLSNFSSNRKEKKELKQLFILYNEFYSDLTDRLTRQVKSLEKFKDELLQTDSDDGLRPEMIHQPYTLFDTFNKEKLVDSNKNQGLSTRALLAQFNYIEVTKNSLAQFHTMFYTFNQAQQMEDKAWNDSISSLTRFSNQLALSKGSALLGGEDVKFIKNTVRSISKDKDWKTINEKALEPLRSFFEGIYVEIDSEETSRQVLPIIDDLQWIIKKRDKTIKDFTDLIEVTIDNIKNEPKS